MMLRHVTALGASVLVGLVTLIWAPETRGQPLPEEDAT